MSMLPAHALVAGEMARPLAKAIFVPSGDQAGNLSHAESAGVMFTCAVPSSYIAKISRSPPARLLTNTTSRVVIGVSTVDESLAGTGSVPPNVTVTVLLYGVSRSLADATV